MTWNELGQELVPGAICHVCWIEPATQLHHGLFGKRTKFKKHIDQRVNACPTCYGCNVGDRIADRREFLERFVVMQIEKFGLDVIQAWVVDFPEQLKRGDEWKQLAQLIGE